MDYNNEPGRWSLADLKQALEDGEGPLFDLLLKIAEVMEKEHSSNFILNKLIIENDLDDDEIEDECDEEE